jgi:hypothetical protein
MTDRVGIHRVQTLRMEPWTVAFAQVALAIALH